MGGLPLCSTHTGAYCRARQRLSLETVSTLTRHTGCVMAERTPVTWHWRGRPVRLVDGATVTFSVIMGEQCNEYSSGQGSKNKYDCLIR